MEPDQIRNWLCGPMVAVATPFTEDYALDLEALHDNIRFMIDRGVRTGQGSLLVGGAGGEHPTLNIEERKLVMSTRGSSSNWHAMLLKWGSTAHNLAQLTTTPPPRATPCACSSWSQRNRTCR